MSHRRLKVTDSLLDVVSVGYNLLRLLLFAEPVFIWVSTLFTRQLVKNT